MVRSGHFFKIPNKYWEIQAEKWGNDWTNYFSLDFSLTRNCDHAGLRFTIDIMNFYFGVNIYDKRHWDWDNEKWNEYKDLK